MVHPKQAQPGDPPNSSDHSDADVTSRSGATLGDFFTIKRGIETGDNDFFIVTPMQALAADLPFEFLRPILPGPQSFPDNEIIADPEGHPILDNKLFLLDCPLPEREIQSRYPGLWNYLQRGIVEGVHERYSCRHRSPWYIQERRPPALFISAYMGRRWDEEGPPFRFILNHSKAVAPNIYLMMYPRSGLAQLLRENYPLQIKFWTALNNIGINEIQNRSCVYDTAPGRLEPKELASVDAHRIARLVPGLIPGPSAQLSLFDEAT